MTIDKATTQRVGPHASRHIREQARGHQTAHDVSPIGGHAARRGSLGRRLRGARRAFSLSLAVTFAATAMVAAAAQQASAAPAVHSSITYTWTSRSPSGAQYTVTCKAFVDKLSWSDDYEMRLDARFGCKGDSSLINYAKIVTHLHKDDAQDVDSKESDSYPRYSKDGWTWVKITDYAGFRTCRFNRTYKFWAEMAYRIELYDRRTGDREVINAGSLADGKRPVTGTITGRGYYVRGCYKNSAPWVR